ncbi:MAG: hypothetical protein ACYC9I_02445 [Desulfuromonadales bacterium]
MSRLTLLVALLLAVTVPAIADEKNHGTGDHSRSIYEQRDRFDNHGFNSADRNLIRSWLSQAERREAARHPVTGLPPGLQKKLASGKELPPGWQKKLSRGTLLDHDYYRHGVMLPDDLLRRLSPRPAGSEILRIEDQVILLDAATRTILDIFGLGGY